MRDAKVLAASDNSDDARQIQRQLKANFEQHTPDVLVPAFDGLDNAQRYYLGP